MSSIHSVKRAQSHLAWDNSIPPVLTIASGDTVTFDCLDASNGQITPSSPPATLSALVFTSLDQVNGPVYVSGAAPGDTLRVDVLAVATAEWGWTGVIPGFGLLADEEGLGGPALKVWRIDRARGEAWFFDGEGEGDGDDDDDDAGERSRRVRIPIRPFAGEMGVAPRQKGAFSTIPPYATGGNIDTKHLTAGSTLFLPVQVPGALFSIGDGHAAQGDGEVCGTAIETPITITVRLTTLTSKPYIQTPHFLTPPAHTPSVSHVPGEQYYATTGVGPDMREATKAAVRSMIAYLGAEHGLTQVEAYMLCSVAADLRLHQVVDMPNYVVGMMLPKSIFVSQ